MTTREYMVDFRNIRQISLDMMAKYCKIGAGLLDMIETGDVTHPNIVSRIQKAYHLSDEQAEELLPEVHRPHSPKYDPDHFVLPVVYKTSIQSMR